MNERIRQLAEQATKEVWGNNSYNGAPEFERYELDQEKFAELIIRECASWLEKTVVECELAGDMLQHFGVEE